MKGKKELVKSLDSFGHKKVKIILIIESLVTLALVIVFMLMHEKWILLPLWIIGISLGVLYSTPPLR